MARADLSGPEALVPPDETDPIEQLRRKYEMWIDQISQTTDVFDDASRGIQDLKSYILQQKRIVETASPACKDQPDVALHAAVLERLDRPFLELTDSHHLSVSMQRSERSVRDFFRNQRIRRINPIKERLQDDLGHVLAANDELDPFIVAYVKDFGAEPAEPLSSPVIGSRSS
jgi:hypothetical protein